MNGRTLAVIVALAGLAGALDHRLRGAVELVPTPATLAAKRATDKIPVVFRAGDPVLLGLVASLARPGGNVTGFSLTSPEVAAKNLSLLKELLPGLRRVGVLEGPANPGGSRLTCRIISVAGPNLPLAGGGTGTVVPFAAFARQPLSAGATSTGTRFAPPRKSATKTVAGAE